MIVEKTSKTTHIRLDRIQDNDMWDGGQLYELNDQNNHLLESAIFGERYECCVHPPPRSSKRFSSFVSPLDEPVDDGVFMPLYLVGIYGLYVKEASEDYSGWVQVTYLDKFRGQECSFCVRCLKGIRWREGVLCIYFDPLNKDEVAIVKEIADWWKGCIEDSKELERRQVLHEIESMDESDALEYVWENATPWPSLEDYNTEEVMAVINRHDAGFRA